MQIDYGPTYDCVRITPEEGDEDTIKAIQDAIYNQAILVGAHATEAERGEMEGVAGGYAERLIDIHGQTHSLRRHLGVDLAEGIPFRVGDLHAMAMATAFEATRRDDAVVDATAVSLVTAVEDIRSKTEQSAMHAVTNAAKDVPNDPWKASDEE